MKICIGLSGGVDSSVAALLLKKQGYDVFGLFMQNWHDASTTLHGECEWEEDRFVAEMVARKIGIPFYFVDLSKVYRERVVDYMFDEYAKGRTPNPDVLCNREIKFAAFWDTAKKLGADMVATGHYCRKDTLKDANGNEVLVAKTWGLNSDGKPADGSELTPIYRIFEGSDHNKDQSYFLCQLTQEQLSTALFPIGDIDKPEVRRIAHEADLPSADKKDSQGICFVGKVDLPTFLKQKLEPKKGNVVEVFDAYYEQNAQYQRIESILTSLLPAGSTEPAKMISDYVSETKTSATDKNGRMAATTEGGDAGKTNICPWDLSKLERLSDEDWEIISQSIDYSDIHFETEVYRSGKKHVKKTRWKENPLAKIVGTHDGAQFYTIGQRKGLNILHQLFKTAIANGIVAKNPTENLEITVQYQNGKYSLMGQNADEYPQAPALGANAVHVTMGAPVMLAGINRSLFATADDELRPVMNGIYFDITTEDITFVASDGHKLVRNKTFVAHGDEKAAFILPKKPATLLKNLLPKEQGDVQIDFDDRNATFTLENYSMICRLIEGRYPNYNSVIPQDNPHKATIDRMMLISALRRVSVFSSQASSLIKLRLSENQIQISAQDIDFSTSAEETLTCQYTGSPMSIGFKSTFLIDILNNISAQEILFELADPSRAGVIVPVEQEEKEDLLMLLMPMMLND